MHIVAKDTCQSLAEECGHFLLSKYYISKMTCSLLKFLVYITCTEIFKLLACYDTLQKMFSH
jgi:hypothetical protein